MTPPKGPGFSRKTLDALEIDDERSFRHVGLYGELREILRKDGYVFRVLPPALEGRWDRALFLNLTYWGTEGGDVLVDERIEADVVTHAAWHHLAARAFPPAPGERPSADAMFLGEAIASAFDVYLVGRLIGHAPDSSFLATQVPAMADVASDAGLSEDDFEALLAGIVADPDRAFEDLRQLLFDATTALFACRSPEEALDALTPLDKHRFAPLLHRYELSNWVLHVRTYGGAAVAADPRVRAVDQALREAPVALDWLTRAWVDGPKKAPG